jgi:SAM-dependent methyltransferase
MDLAEQNREAWNAASKGECDWSIPVSADEIKLAKEGSWSVRLTPKKSMPHEWVPPLNGLEILCLASGGGQQVPILAAAGAKVTSLDISDEQLSKDVLVAKQHDLPVTAIRGEMTDLGRFKEGSFDLIFNPASTLFIEDVEPVWKACYRVLRPGGVLLSGSMNPSFFLFDHDEALSQGILNVKFPLPYSDLTSLTDDQMAAMRKSRKTIEFGHSLDDLIGGQIRSGFQIAGFYEDYWDDSVTLLNLYSPTLFATRALKPTC